jgi:hypothetical protein
MLMQRIRDELTAHVGTPNVVQKLLIERAVVLSLRLAMLDQKIIDDQIIATDNHMAIAWQNALTRTLVALGVHAEATPTPSGLEAVMRELGSGAP